MHERFHRSDVLGHSGENPLKLDEGLADGHAATSDAALADRAFVITAALLHHRKRLAYRAEHLEIPQEENRICEVADLRCLVGRAPEDALLHERHDARDAAIREKAEQLVNLDGEQPL